MRTTATRVGLGNFGNVPPDFLESLCVAGGSLCGGILNSVHMDSCFDSEVIHYDYGCPLGMFVPILCAQALCQLEYPTTAWLALDPTGSLTRISSVEWLVYRAL